MTLYCNEALLHIVIINFIFFRTGTGLRCYICDTETNPGCEGSVYSNDVQVMDCVNYFPMIGVGLVLHPTTYACQKLQLKDFYDQVTTLRQCVFMEDENMTFCDLQHDRLLELNYTLEYCGLCTSDLCNTSCTSYVFSSVLYYVIIINLWRSVKLYF